MAELNKPNSVQSAVALSFREKWPIFYDLVEDFPDFTLAPGLSEEEIDQKEEELEFQLDADVKELFQVCSALTMNGLIIRADQLGVINLPESEALILGYLNLGSAADRLLMLPDDSGIYYLEQHNGAITRIAKNLAAFFNEVLPRRLYG